MKTYKIYLNGRDSVIVANGIVRNNGDLIVYCKYMSNRVGIDYVLDGYAKSVKVHEEGCTLYVNADEVESIVFEEKED